MNKKYYDGFDVTSILFKNLEPRKARKVLEAFAEYDGVDAVEVVRCKDCKNRDRYACNHIRLGETKCGVTDDWFCADGERKEE